MDEASEYVPFAIGSYRDALTYVGRIRGPIAADVPIEVGLVKGLASLVEDPNPAYWLHVGQTSAVPASAQPAVLLALFSPLRWYPTADPLTVLGASIPLPGTTMVNVECEHTFARPLAIGQWLSMTEWVTRISPLKSTRLGVGHFVSTAMTFVDISDGQVVARGTNTLFRFDKAEGPG